MSPDKHNPAETMKSQKNQMRKMESQNNSQTLKSYSKANYCVAYDLTYDGFDYSELRRDGFLPRCNENDMQCRS